MSNQNAEIISDMVYMSNHASSSKVQDLWLQTLRDFAASLIGAGISPPAQKPVSELGGSGAGLEGNPCKLTSTTQTFESWVEQLGNLYRCGADGVHQANVSQHVFQMLLARDLLDEYRAFAAVCKS